ncbi:MAG: hypothetical protein QW222_07455 [Candidatus Bathyarchaeia archaeon]
MDRAVVELAKTLKQSVRDLGVSLEQLCDIVLQMEKRLQVLENIGDLVKGEENEH